jgi:talin
LVEDTKTLVAGAASNQEQLANAAQMAVKTITRLADVVKFGAGSLGSEQQEAQVGPHNFLFSSSIKLVQDPRSSN